MKLEDFQMFLDNKFNMKELDPYNEEDWNENNNEFKIEDIIISNINHPGYNHNTGL